MDKGIGWLLYAWIMLLIAGIMNIFQGIAALDQTAFWTDYGAVYAYGSLRTWGWILLIAGALQIIAAISVYGGGSYGRWAGIFFASLNMIVQLIFLPAYPFWAIVIIAMDALIIYALTVYGGQARVDS
jgi:hypothetical protein